MVECLLLLADVSLGRGSVHAIRPGCAYIVCALDGGRMKVVSVIDKFKFQPVPMADLMSVLCPPDWT